MEMSLVILFVLLALVLLEIKPTSAFAPTLNLCTEQTLVCHNAHDELQLISLLGLNHRQI